MSENDKPAPPVTPAVSREERNVRQIAVAHEGIGASLLLFALAEDRTVWQYLWTIDHGDVWRQLPPLPLTAPLAPTEDTQ